jgi:hypothetical protein
MSRNFLLGKDAEASVESTHPLLGIRFIALPGLEFVGEITSVFDSIATVTNPMLISKDKTVPGRLEFRKFNTINPLVRDEIQVHVANIIFSFKPSDTLIKNYIAAKSGLVSAQTLVQ